MKTHSFMTSPGIRSLLLVAAILVALGSVARSASAMPQPQDSLLTTPAALIVNVDARGGVTLNEKPYGTVADPAKLTARLNEIFAARTRNLVFADRDGASMTQIPLADRIAKRVYVHPAAAVPIATLVKLLSAIRTTEAKPLQLDLNRGDLSYSLVIQSAADEKTSVPDPQRLTLRLEDYGKLSMNTESFPTVDALRERLTAIFAQRQRDHEFAPGTNAISRSVWLQVDPSRSQSDILDVLQAISATYAQPIYLQMTAPVRVYEDIPPQRKPTKPARRRTRRG